MIKSDHTIRGEDIVSLYRALGKRWAAAVIQDAETLDRCWRKDFTPRQRVQLSKPLPPR